VNIQENTKTKPTSRLARALNNLALRLRAMTHSQTSLDQDLRTSLDVKLASANGKHWRLEGPGWTMQPIGQVSADEARDICERALSALTAPPRPDHAGGVGEDDITQAMIQAGRHAANLNDGTLASIYLAMANASPAQAPDKAVNRGVVERAWKDGAYWAQAEAGNADAWLMVGALAEHYALGVIGKDAAQAPDKAAEREGVDRWEALKRVSMIQARELKRLDPTGETPADLEEAMQELRAALAPKPTGTEAGRGVIPRMLLDPAVKAQIRENARVMREQKAATPTPPTPDSTAQGDGTSREGGR
jgi:hypothetical protein